MYLIGLALICAAVFVLYRSVTRKKPDGNQTQHPWSPPEDDGPGKKEF